MEVSDGQVVVDQRTEKRTGAIGQLLLGLEQEIDIDQPLLVTVAQYLDLKFVCFDAVVIDLHLLVGS